MMVDPEGQPATTEWRVMGRHEGLTWLELKPLTGRTHQIRVHCAAAGWPLVGDAIYGSREAASGLTLHLLARQVVVPLYANRDPITVTAPVPRHMAPGLASLGYHSSPE